jgi:hypothetical protein
MLRSSSLLLRPSLRRLLSDSAKPLGVPYSAMRIGVLKETTALERRVAASPE